MHIEPNRDPLMVTSSPSTQSAVQAETRETDAFESSVNKLKAELLALREDRPAVVQRGQSLQESPSYPPLETVVKIANLLGNHVDIED